MLCEACKEVFQAQVNWRVRRGSLVEGPAEGEEWGGCEGQMDEDGEAGENRAERRGLIMKRSQSRGFVFVCFQQDLDTIQQEL